MEKSRISFQIDECFIKSIRNESRRRKENSIGERYENVQDFYKEFVRLGLISEHDGSDLKMKKKVIRSLITE